MFKNVPHVQKFYWILWNMFWSQKTTQWLLETVFRQSVRIKWRTLWKTLITKNEKSSQRQYWNVTKLISILEKNDCSFTDCKIQENLRRLCEDPAEIWWWSYLKNWEMATNLLCKISASASKEVCTTKFGVDTAENAPPKGSKLGILKTKENVNENRKFAEIAITKTRRDGDGVGVGFTKRPPNNQLHLGTAEIRHCKSPPEESLSGRTSQSM